MARKKPSRPRTKTGSLGGLTELWKRHRDHHNAAEAVHMTLREAILHGTLPAGQSLGLSSAVYGQARIELPPGAIIALYTDGLVETRTRSFDQGISALRAVLSGRHGQLGPACDTLIASLAERSEDDVTVVLARTP